MKGKKPKNVSDELLKAAKTTVDISASIAVTKASLKALSKL